MTNLWIIENEGMTYIKLKYELDITSMTNLRIIENEGITKWNCLI
jgi:hypothetical protein